VPDQSLDQQTEPTTATLSATPDDTSANHPEAASASSLAANVTEASEGEKQQADVTINQDPVVGAAVAPVADEYDDEEKWPYRALQERAGDLDVNGRGKREELIERIRTAEAAKTSSVTSPDAKASTGGEGPETPASESEDGVARTTVNPDVYANGGIALDRVRTGEHANVLQGLSDERRQQQLAAARERSAQAADA